MEVLTSADYSEIIRSNEIESTIAGMLSVLEDSRRKHNELENQKWYQRMILTVFGKNKATVKEIKDNHNKLDKYIAEAITELYNQNRISLSYLVVLGNRINELSYGDNLLRRNLIEVTSKINEKIESVDHFHTLIEAINFGMYDHIPKLVALISIVSSCDSRVYADVQSEFLNKTEILRKSLSEKYILSDDAINFEAEIGAIKELSINNIGVLKMQVSRMSDDVVVSELYEEISRLIEKMYTDGNPKYDAQIEISITYDELFNRLVEDQKNYYEYLNGQELQDDINAVEVEDTLKEVIDKTNCVGVCDESVIPLEEEILPKYEINNVLTIVEATVIEGKDVYVNNLVTVKDYFEFDRCIIHINSNDEGRLNVTDAKTLVINNCLVVGKTCCSRPFIHLEDGYFTGKNCIFDNPSFLLEEVNSINISTDVPIVEFENCNFKHIGSSLYEEKFHESRYKSEDDIHLSVKNCYFEVEKTKFLPESPILCLHADGAIFENSIFEGDYTLDDYFEDSKLELIRGDTVIYNNVKVLKLSGSAYFSKINGMNIKDCISFKLDSLYQKEFTVEYLTAEDCFDFMLDFSGPGATINNSQFKNLCFDEDCYLGTVIKLERDSKTDQRNTIMNCIFKNIKSVETGSIIKCFSEIRDSVIVTDCLFEDIQCERNEFFKSIGNIHLFVDKDVDVFSLMNNKGL